MTKLHPFSLLFIIGQLLFQGRVEKVPSLLSATMETRLGNYRRLTALVCVDDIIVFSRFLPDHLQQTTSVDKLPSIIRLPGCPGIQYSKYKIYFIGDIREWCEEA